MGSDLKVIYLGGLGRSGSTLLERLLGELPGVTPAGEVAHLWQRGIAENELCACGKPFGDCDYWCRVGASAFGGWDNAVADRVARLRNLLDRTRYIPALARSGSGGWRNAEVAEYTSYYLRVYRAIAALTGCAAVVDSSKHASLAFCLSRNPDVDLRVVHLVRDSRAVAFSWTRRVARPEADPGAPGGYMTTYRPASAAAHWNAQNGALHLLRRRGAAVRLVRYEDLVAAPEATVAELARFAGLPLDGVSFDFIGADGDRRSAVLRQVHTVSGNPMRFATGHTVIRADERWRTAMPLRQRREVTALTLPLLRRYGYPWRAA